MDAKEHQSLSARLKHELKNRKMSVPEFEEQTGIPKDRVYKWLKRATAKIGHEDAETINRWFIGQLENVPREPSNGKKERLSEKAIYNLTESNRLIAESNASLADSNKELVSMVKENIIAHAPSQNPLSVDAKLVKVLAMIAKVGTGTRWKSLEEAVAALNKEIFGMMGKDQESDTQRHLGKKRTA